MSNEPTLFCFLCFPLLPVSTNEPIQKVVWLSVTNPVILSWHSSCCWAFLSIQSLPVSCMENSAQEKKTNHQTTGLILTNICDKMKVFTQLYWNLLRHMVRAAYWRLLGTELEGPVIKHKKMACVFFFIQDLSPESVRHTVCFGQSWNSSINFKTLLLLLLLNPAISTLILARAVEGVMDVFKLNTKNRGYVFCPPPPGTDKNRVFAVTDGSFSYSL